MKNKKVTDCRASRCVEENLQPQSNDEDRAINERILLCDYRMVMCTISILVMPSSFLEIQMRRDKY